MKPLDVFILKRCPYCIKAKLHIENLLKQEKYQAINIRYIDERQEKELAKTYDYYYVPAFYVDKTKLYEGAINLSQMEVIFDEYLKILSES